MVRHRYVFIDRGSVIEEGTLASVRPLPDQALEVKMTLELEEGAAFSGRPVIGGNAEQQLLRFALGSEAEVPDFLRSLVNEADLYGAVVIRRILRTRTHHPQERLQ